MFWISCPDCNGWNPECEACEGGGKKNLRRCPSSFVDARMRSFMVAYRQYDERGVLPAPGSWNDQAALFVAYVGVVDAERGAIAAERERLREAARRARKGKR